MIYNHRFSRHIQSAFKEFSNCFDKSHGNFGLLLILAVAVFLPEIVAFCGLTDKCAGFFGLQY